MDAKRRQESHDIWLNIYTFGTDISFIVIVSFINRKILNCQRTYRKSLTNFITLSSTYRKSLTNFITLSSTYGSHWQTLSLYHRHTVSHWQTLSRDHPHTGGHWQTLSSTYPMSLPGFIIDIPEVTDNRNLHRHTGSHWQTLSLPSIYRKSLTNFITDISEVTTKLYHRPIGSHYQTLSSTYRKSLITETYIDTPEVTDKLNHFVIDIPEVTDKLDHRHTGGHWQTLSSTYRKSLPNFIIDLSEVTTKLYHRPTGSHWQQKLTSTHRKSLTNLSSTYSMSLRHKVVSSTFPQHENWVISTDYIVECKCNFYMTVPCDNGMNIKSFNLFYIMSKSVVNR